jgi:acetolactate synthase small subunit
MMDRFELLLNDEAGALARVVTLVSGRRWKLQSLSFPPSEVPDRRRLVLDLDSGGRGDQVSAQLAKLYDVLSVTRTGI